MLLLGFWPPGSKYPWYGHQHFPILMYDASASLHILVVVSDPVSGYPLAFWPRTGPPLGPVFLFVKWPLETHSQSKHDLILLLPAFWLYYDFFSLSSLLSSFWSLSHLLTFSCFVCPNWSDPECVVIVEPSKHVAVIYVKKSRYTIFTKCISNIFVIAVQRQLRAERSAGVSDKPDWMPDERQFWRLHIPNPTKAHICPRCDSCFSVAEPIMMNSRWRKPCSYFFGYTE